ncbi:MAG: SpoIID/LytB domain-containing protein [Timaviella obliquedivisa GSE-PSE-MK23-08B]|nr:SpoIID/LytB domain-containing protein [Timaviella obliquedivisa GSE-PSE-MK23-08B]
MKKPLAPVWINFWFWSGLSSVTLAICGSGLLIQPAAAQDVQNPTQNPSPGQNIQNPIINAIIDVGVVQRFGSATDDVITLKPVEGDRLTLKFADQGVPKKIVTANEVTLNVTLQPLPEPQVKERVVLSSHRSFESAEDSANQWKSKGIDVELAQPRQWQVWAKRETYKTPLLRRLLMQNLRANGATIAFIDSKLETQAPKATFTTGGNRYQRDDLVIDAGSDRVEVTFNHEDHGRRVYGGDLKLQPNAYGTYTLVNQVPIETYLRGVVPNEIGASAPPTAIEAQAILARTYALRNLRRFAIDNYQMCADTQCQVYYGLSGSAPESDRAIAATAGQVLTYQNELVDALYSSTTGGVTAPFSNVWNGADRPYLQAVVDSAENVWDLSAKPLTDEANFRAFIAEKKGFNEASWDYFRWRTNSTLAELSQDLRSYLQSKQSPLEDFTKIQDIKVLERSPAGRVQQMSVTTDKGVIQLEKDEILRAFYAPSSTLFYLDPIYEVSTKALKAPKIIGTAPQKQVSRPAIQAAPKVLKGYAFVGGGFGHGVGMSQTGAYHLGDLGWSSSRILSFYYPGTQLQNLNPSIVFWQNP